MMTQLPQKLNNREDTKNTKALRNTGYRTSNTFESFVPLGSILLIAGILFISPTMGFADEKSDMADAIQLQQKKLDEQQQTLKDMQRQLDTMSGTTEPVAQTATPATSARRTDTQTQRRDAHQHGDQWEGSFGMDGLKTRIKIGGFVELDLIHDSDAIGSKAQFITSTIVTRNATKVEGADGQTSMSVNPTRLFVETRTPVGDHRITSFVSVDLFGDALSSSADLRMRQAYAEISNTLFFGGDLLLGQAWSTFADMEAFPNVLDFEGPNSFLGTRQPLVRWTKGVGNGAKVMLAAETPANHIIEGADSLTTWPDGVLSMAWDKSRFHLMGSLLVRDLRASFNDGATASTVGFGGSLSGKVRTPFLGERDFATASLTVGEGIGGAMLDAPADAVYDPSGSLEAIPALGWFVSYEHGWTEKLSSTAVYSELSADNQTAQAFDAFKKTRYASLNLAFHPTPAWLLGIEGLWGSREDNDGAYGSTFRTLLTTKLNF